MNDYETKHGDRSITFRFESGTDEEGNRRVIDVSAYHVRERKAFTAMWTPKTIEQRDGYSTERFALFGGGRLLSEPTARFSQRGLEEFSQRALAAYLQRLEVTA